MRPCVQWKRVPEVVHAGERFVVELELSGAEGTKIDGLTIEFAGKRTWADDSTHELAGSIAVLESTTMLLPASKCYEATLEVPATAMPSGVPAEDAVLEERDRSSVEWFVVVRASIPWWPDVNASHRIVLVPDRARASPSTASAPQTTIFKRFAYADGLALEISFDDACYSAGDEVRGKVAVDGLAGRALHEIEIAVVTARHVRHSDHAEDRVFPLVSLLHVRTVAEGDAIAFSGKVPEGTPPDHPSWAEIRCRLDAATAHWRVPLTIVEGPPRMNRRASPKVGAKRWRDLWRAVAASHDLELDGHGVLHGTRSEPAFEIDLDAQLRANVRRTATLDFEHPRVRAAMDAFASSERAADAVTVTVPAWHAHDEERLDTFLRSVRVLCEALAATSAGGPYR